MKWIQNSNSLSYLCSSFVHSHLLQIGKLIILAGKRRRKRSRRRKRRRRKIAFNKHKPCLLPPMLSFQGFISPFPSSQSFGPTIGSSRINLWQCLRVDRITARLSESPPVPRGPVQLPQQGHCKILLHGTLWSSLSLSK